MRVFILLVVNLLNLGQSALADNKLEVFDAHIHYSSNVWSIMPPEQAMAVLSEAGIKRALVSGTPGEGAERLYRAAPDRVVPFLRPYAEAKHRYIWYRDTKILDYLKEQLARIPYRGIGEFHLAGRDARNPVVTEMVRLARERGLALHVHTDEEGLKVLLDQAADIPVIWAHGGFDVPETTLRELLSQYTNLYIELSYREGMMTELDTLTPVWVTLMTDFHTRFLVGTDTYKLERWFNLPDLADEAREWLQQLPKPVARDIAYDNAARLFP